MSFLMTTISAIKKTTRKNNNNKEAKKAKTKTKLDI